MADGNKGEIKELVEVHNKTFNLEAYAADYTGFTKAKRLRFIAERCPELRLRAFRSAIDELKLGPNTQYYTETVARAREFLHGDLGDNWGLDQKYVSTENRKSIDLLARLEANLQQLKKEGEREPTRVAYEKVALHHLERGDFSTALTKFLETKEYGSNNNHTLSTCLQVIEASIQMGSMSHVKNQAQRAQSIPQFKADAVVRTRVLASLGLSALKAGQYRQAAQNFTQCDYALGTSYNSVISLRDIAVYASVCALATYSRSDLKRLLSNGQFRKFFDLIPEWRTIITDYYNSKYAACFSALNTLEPDLRLDLYLADTHVRRLYQQIRNKAMVQYFRPFQKVHIPAMAKAFAIDPLVLERNLVQLIAEDQIQARIDSHNKILLARHADRRNATYQQSLKMGDKYVRDCRSMLLRMSMAEHDFRVAPPEQKRKEDKDDPRGGGQGMLPPGVMV